ncbi:MAG: hypothetical protein AAF222_00060 [Pseudomonadota bacterium]
MTLLIAMALAGLVLGAVLPRSWGILGYLGAAAILFALQIGINAAAGFAGSSIEESLLLFNGSYASYLGFNLQITYRAFAVPLLALSIPYIYRLGR